MMEVHLLEKRKDGYEAYCVILNPEEVRGIKEIYLEKEVSPTMESAIEACINVGAEF